MSTTDTLAGWWAHRLWSLVAPRLRAMTRQEAALTRANATLAARLADAEAALARARQEHADQVSALKVEIGQLVSTVGIREHEIRELTAVNERTMARLDWETQDYRLRMSAIMKPE